MGVGDSAGKGRYFHSSLFKSVSNLTIWSKCRRDRKRCKFWKQDEVVSDRLKVVCMGHMEYSIIYIMEMRESKRKGVRERAGWVSCGSCFYYLTICAVNWGTYFSFVAVPGPL